MAPVCSPGQPPAGSKDRPLLRDFSRDCSKRGNQSHGVLMDVNCDFFQSEPTACLMASSSVRENEKGLSVAYRKDRRSAVKSEPTACLMANCSVRENEKGLSVTYRKDRRSAVKVISW
ncbi:unnamed protein product [Gongylonema pulchrum]|uniref:Uncharacterized protein n=1 Tax=Gongylonema pulchrum TaxID=637853 RepID=A0A183DQY2_9BILA|nr:unnamed protein product [Gongylonema pulchrum]